MLGKSIFPYLWEDVCNIRAGVFSSADGQGRRLMLIAKTKYGATLTRFSGVRYRLIPR